ncbi:NAD(P)H-hydrate dehydratase [Pseudodesulfovibrio tunisiensis]|uniref:NAD(P)H-hydrate dehydratase n=1 Tax=Pseudodesulfovibrio tunisiensis TaxID=463192 RepID=UPI001FB2AA04|nr:NAD(P)H-hydrate dehydratase [Pseudodesulfovibrio tunisiensis]
MLTPLPTPAEMSTWDSETIQGLGFPGAALMETASREALNVLLREYGPVTGRTVYCFAGSGNNGGDAFALSRHLLDMDAKVSVFHTKPKKRYRGETRMHLNWAREVGVPIHYLSQTDISTLPQPDIIVDGILGTGFAGELRPDALELIRTLNSMGSHAFVLAIDIPSGLNGMTGQPQPEAIRANATATFEAAKLGLAMPEARTYTGKVHVRSIGIPRKIRENLPTRHYLIEPDIMNHIPVPGLDMHKGTAGHVVIVGGSPGLTGAPHLAALGALRAGAGLATIACPGALAQSIKAGSPDIMTLALGCGPDWDRDCLAQLLEHSRRFDAAVVGPGLGRDPKTVDFLRAFVAEWPTHVVYDADALFALAQTPELIGQFGYHTVLTPHPGEMARLAGVSTAEIQADRIGAVRAFTESTSATLVLKGAGTIVANEVMTCLSPFAEPNLAVGGSGDVLSGIIGALTAQGMPPVRAASLAVYWHGLAGKLLRKEYPMRGNLAHEIADMLPRAAKEHCNAES